MLILSILTLFLSPISHAGRTAEFPKTGVYVNSEASPLLALLGAAKSKIDIEIYTMTDPTIRSLLRDAIRRGVKIRIVKDARPVGKNCDVFAANEVSAIADADCLDQRKLVSEVRASGGSYEAFNKANLCPNKKADGCFEHGKIALVDDLALISTGNFDATNLCLANESETKCNRDYTLVNDNREVVNALENIFAADLRGASYDVASLIPSSLTDILTVSPDSLRPLVKFIDSARTSIDLEAQYLKDPDLNAALSRAAARGVSVSLTVASACSFGKPKPAEAQQIQQVYSVFDTAGISSRMFTSADQINGRSGYMHAKVIVVDEKRVWVGSVNGSSESLSQNREYGLILDSIADVSTVLATVKLDHSEANSESWEESLSCAKDYSKGGEAGSNTRQLVIRKTGSHKKAAVR
ncbi:MAG: phospholipase D-like domain-containing protein [Bdellovibrionota bacterium]